MLGICKKQSSHLCTNLHMWACTCTYLQHHPYSLVGEIIVRSHEVPPPIGIKTTRPPTRCCSQMLCTCLLDIWHLGTLEPGKEVDEATVTSSWPRPNDLPLHSAQTSSRYLSVLVHSLLLGLRPWLEAGGGKGLFPLTTANCSSLLRKPRQEPSKQKRRRNTAYCATS